jgi:hypothetical protein
MNGGPDFVGWAGTTPALRRGMKAIVDGIADSGRPGERLVAVGIAGSGPSDDRSRGMRSRAERRRR